MGGWGDDKKTKTNIEDAVNASPDVGDLRRCARNYGENYSHPMRRDYEMSYNYTPK